MALKKYLTKVTMRGTLIERAVVESESMEHALADLKKRHHWRGAALTVESEQFEGQFDGMVPFSLEKE